MADVALLVAGAVLVVAGAWIALYATFGRRVDVGERLAPYGRQGLDSLGVAPAVPSREYKPGDLPPDFDDSPCLHAGDGSCCAPRQRLHANRDPGGPVID